MICLHKKTLSWLPCVNNVHVFILCVCVALKGVLSVTTLRPRLRDLRPPAARAFPRPALGSPSSPASSRDRAHFVTAGCTHSCEDKACAQKHKSVFFFFFNRPADCLLKERRWWREIVKLPWTMLLTECHHLRSLFCFYHQHFFYYYYSKKN